MKLSEVTIFRSRNGDVFVRSLREFHTDPMKDMSDQVCTGGYLIEFTEASGDVARQLVLSEFNAVVVRDNVDPHQAHSEFMKIDEYRSAIAPDIGGSHRRRLPSVARPISET